MSITRRRAPDAGARSPWGALDRVDRALGDAARAWGNGAPRTAAVLRASSEALAPAFEGLVAVMVARRATRRDGMVALTCAVTAALTAKWMRDRLGRPRPGARPQGGFPSRHAAAASAIATVLAHRPCAGPATSLCAAAGLAGRVLRGHHEPGDILVGALLGRCVGRAARHVARTPGGIA